MRQWRFVDSPETGEQWLQRPEKLTALVEFDTNDSKASAPRRRIMVATRSWVLRHMGEIGASDPGYLFLPPLLVVSDGSREHILRSLEAALNAPGVGHFGTPA